MKQFEYGSQDSKTIESNTSYVIIKYFFINNERRTVSNTLERSMNDPIENNIVKFVSYIICHPQ